MNYRRYRRLFWFSVLLSLLLHGMVIITLRIPAKWIDVEEREWGRETPVFFPLIESVPLQPERAPLVLLAAAEAQVEAEDIKLRETRLEEMLDRPVTMDVPITTRYSMI